MSVKDAFRSFGSYLAFILRFTNYIIGEFQAFSLDNSMIKKLYSADRDKNSKTEKREEKDDSIDPKDKKVTQLEKSIT